MSTYRYEAAYSSGETARGVVEAVSREKAVAQIRQNFEIVLRLDEVPKFVVRRSPSRLKKINAKILSLTCRQFSIILKAGLPLAQTVELVADQCGDKNLRNILRQTAEDVLGGWSMSYSFEQRASDSLPPTFRETVRAGEESGDLVAAFDRMTGYFERMNKTRESVVSALTYPAFVSGVAFVVIGIIMGYAVPTFIDMFDSLNIELPWVTKALIAVSGFFQKYFWAMFAFAALVLFSVRLYGATKSGGMRLSRAWLSLPVIGSVIRMSNASQFAHTMSTLLAAGMPIIQAIEASGRTMSNLCMSQDVINTLPGVESGHSFGECLEYSKNLPAMLTRMTKVGEATGSLEETLHVLAEYYDSETDVRTKRAVELLNPIIIVILSVFVVFVLMAVYLPMFGMYGAI